MEDGLTCRACEQLAQDDLNWIEPILQPWLATIGNASLIVPLTVGPHSDLVVIVKAKCSRQRIDQDCIRRRAWHNVRDIELEEVQIGETALVADTADIDHNQEDCCNKEQHRNEYGEEFPVLRGVS